MTGRTIAVFGIYPHSANFEYGLNVLKIAGFRETDTSVLLQKRAGTKDLAAKRATNAPEMAPTGAGSRAVIEGAHGWWAGTGALSALGLGPLLVAGPIVARLAEIGFGGTLGRLSGALLGLQIHEYEAKRYQKRIENGGILLSLDCDSPNCAEKAKLLPISTGAEDVSSAGEIAAEYDGTDRPMRRITFG
jgi:hypothetical protein